MTTALGAIDILVLAASLVAVVVIGLKVSGQTSDLEAYLLGDRNLPWWAILGSIVATETSTATVLSVPGLGYGTTGLRFLQLALGYIVGRAVVALASDPDVARWNGQSLSSGQLARVYGFTDLDGSQPDAWRYLVEVQDAGKPADVTGYR